MVMHIFPSRFDVHFVLGLTAPEIHWLLAHSRAMTCPSAIPETTMYTDPLLLLLVIGDVIATKT